MARTPIPTTNSYFTWPDRGLRYECRGCGACCKGHGIGIDAAGGQLVQLVAKRPDLAAFVRRRGDAITAFNPRDRCWFLADDGLCRIELEDGRAAKPASCRLFPFNRVFHVGGVMVIDFNSVICPVQRATDGIAHADVLAEISTITDPAIVGTTLPGDATVIERERVIAAQIFAGDAAAAQGVELATPAGFEFVASTGWRMPSADTLANAIALTPSLRFNELYGPRKLAASALGGMWLAWLGFAAMGEVLAQRALGMQELTTLWSEQAPLMHAIARWRDIAVRKPGPIELPGGADAQPVTALAQKLVDNRKSRRPLGELIEAALAKADAVTRVTALKQADAIVRAAL
ncbi:MAG TPA: YkgJ family cysteine cluster protein [Kofleriaceae bacterium]|nr:YkgJ family cysteine cluster protein [Kofleriaceae bacterium]